MFILFSNQLNQNVRFKIATNSVRRVRWYTPLGFFAGNPIVISNLGTILPNGGTVPQFSAVIARVYPVLYLDKKEDGSHGSKWTPNQSTLLQDSLTKWFLFIFLTALHNEKVHFKKMADFEKRRQICLESLLSQVTSEVESENPSMDTDDYPNPDSYSDHIARQVCIRSINENPAWWCTHVKLAPQVPHLLPWNYPFRSV